MVEPPSVAVPRDLRARLARPALTMALAGSVVLGAALTLGSLTRGHNWGGDFAGYLLQARALLSGRIADELAANRFTLAHSSTAIVPVAYPWGFPALLAPLVAVFGVAPLALKTVGVVSWVGLLALIALGLRRTHRGVWGLALVAGLAVDPALFTFTNQILSDLPFLLLATAAVLWMGRVGRTGRPGRDGVLLGGLMAAAFFVRTTGLLLLPTLAVAQIASVSRGPATIGSGVRRWSIRLAPYASFAVLVTAWRLALPSGGGAYLALLHHVSSASVWANLAYYWRQPARLLPGVPHAQAVWEMTVPLAVLGAVRQGRAGLHVVAWILATMLLYLVWPFQQGIRFLFPIVPFYASFIVSGLAWLAGEAGARARGVRTAACLAPVVAVGLLVGHRGVARVRANLARGRRVTAGPFSPPALALFHFVSASTPTGATVIFFKPRVLRLMTGRRAFNAARVAEPPEATVLCLAQAASPGRQPSPAQVRALVHSGQARRVFGNRRFTCYRLAPPSRKPREMPR